MDYPTPAGSGPGIVDSVKRLLATLVAIVHGRFELVATELQEESARLVGILLWSVAALLCATIGLSFVAVSLLLAAPAERRVLVAALLARFSPRRGSRCSSRGGCNAPSRGRSMRA